MNIARQPSRLLFAAALIGLGVTGLVNGDFALGWQHIPLQQAIPGQTVIAYLCAILEVVTGMGLLAVRTLTISSRILFLYLMLWVVLLEVPVVIDAPCKADSWGAVGEIAAMAAGGWALFAAHAGTWEQKHLRFIVGPDGIRAARGLLVASLPMMGLEVLLLGATYQLPPWLAWLPSSVDWVYLSGIGSLAACLGLLLGIWPRLAASLEAGMLAVITVWFWGPLLHTGRTATTAFLISSLIVAGVWLVADSYGDVPWFATGRPLWKK